MVSCYQNSRLKKVYAQFINVVIVLIPVHIVSKRTSG